jgi:thiamine-monophosphate kinase
MGEFDYIKKYFSPLSQGFLGAANLKDDVCLFNDEFIITKDMLVGGVHFFKNDPAFTIAKKALRVNISDIIAKGTKPYGYFLGLGLPKNFPYKEEWIKKFSKGLEEDQKEFSLHLMGGDSVSTLNDIIISITMIGKKDKSFILPQRSNAKQGDYIYISDRLGYSSFALQHRLNKINLPNMLKEEFLNHYLIPFINMNYILQLVPYANATMDISDGLLQDLNHICEVSGVGAELKIESFILPQYIDSTIDNYQTALTGGDDYKLLMTSSHSPESFIHLKQQPILIGRINDTKKIECYIEDKKTSFNSMGYQHESL